MREPSLPRLFRDRFTGWRLAIATIGLIVLGFLLQIGQGKCPTP